MEELNGKFFYGPKENEAWLRQELYGILGEIKIEDDCDTLCEQLCRDLYYESQGSEIDLAQVDELEVVSTKLTIHLRPIGSTPVGVLCESLDTYEDIDGEVEDEEPELLLVSGTYFSDSTSLQSETPVFFPEENPFDEAVGQVTVTDAIETGGLVLSRAIATCGNLAIRHTYSPVEFANLCEFDPVIDTNDFLRLSGKLRTKEYVRAVPKLVTVIPGAITSITATYANSVKQHYGM